MGSLGPFEIIIIAVVLLLFFGAKRLPELAKGIGKALKEFKKATKDVQDEIENSAGSSPNNNIDYDETYDDYRNREANNKQEQGDNKRKEN